LPLAVSLLALSADAQSLDGFVDIHAHSDPDSMPRSIDALDLVRKYAKNGVRAVVLKNHYEPTASLAFIVRKSVPGIEVFGGIALNGSLGGINASAIERMAALKGGYGRIVWMPTFDSEHNVRGKQDRPFVSVSRKGELLPEVKQALAQISKHKLALATGHSSPDEVIALIRAAKSAGIDRIVVTHPMLSLVGMTTEQMKQAAKLGAYLEFVGNGVIGHTKAFEFGDYVKAIRAVGVDHCILSSDLGQAGNPDHVEGMLQILKGLSAAGLSDEELAKMTRRNPARLLGLE
jgi:hypothetical protein